MTQDYFNLTLFNLGQGRMQWHTFDEKPGSVGGGDYHVTGWDPEQRVQPGFTFLRYFGANAEQWEVLEVTQRRDHQGRFNNPGDEINSFFEARLTLKDTQLLPNP